MNKLEEYILRYQGLHDGTDPFLIGTKQTINNTVVGNGKIIFDGSQLGKKLPPYLQSVIDYKQRAITVLDYGCGRAVQVFTPLGIYNNKTLLGLLNGMVQCYYCYDPAVRQYSIKPPQGMTFDVVCCADVMEHIPEDFVGQVVDEIAAYTKDDGVAMFTISGNLARKSFKDGENLHATIKPVEWWLDVIKTRFGDKSFLMFHNDDTKPEEPIQLKYKNSTKFNAWNFKDAKLVVGGLPCVSEEV